MAGKIDAYENAILNLERGGASLTAWTPYLGLFTTMPADDGTGGVEVSGGSYARQALSYAAPSGGSMASNADALFPVASAGWGTIVGVGAFDAVSAGVLKETGAITSVVINTSDQLKFASGNVVRTED